MGIYDKYSSYFAMPEKNPENEELIMTMTGCEYKREVINFLLRKGKTLDEEERIYVKELDCLLAHSYILDDVVLYRAVNSCDLEDHRKGNVYCDKGFMEASFNSDIDDVIPGDMVFEFKIRRETHCIYTTPFNYRDDEQGVLFARNFKYRVMEIKKIKTDTGVKTLVCAEGYDG